MIIKIGKQQLFLSYQKGAPKIRELNRNKSV